MALSNTLHHVIAAVFTSADHSNDPHGVRLSIYCVTHLLLEIEIWLCELHFEPEKCSVRSPLFFLSGPKETSKYHTHTRTTHINTHTRAVPLTTISIQTVYYNLKSRHSCLQKTKNKKQTIIYYVEK